MSKSLILIFSPSPSISAPGLFSLIRVKSQCLGQLAVQEPMPKRSETPGKIKHLGEAMGWHDAELIGGGIGGV